LKRDIILHPNPVTHSCRHVTTLMRRMAGRRSTASRAERSDMAKWDRHQNDHAVRTDPRATNTAGVFMPECGEKIRHPTRDDALAHIKRLVWKNHSAGQSERSTGLAAYPCEHCQMWHVGHQRSTPLVWCPKPGSIQHSVYTK
jgi:hypothetical protein